MTNLEELEEWGRTNKTSIMITFDHLDFGRSRWHISGGFDSTMYEGITVDEAASKFMMEAKRKVKYGVCYKLLDDSYTRLVYGGQDNEGTYLNIFTRGSNPFDLYKVGEGVTVPMFNISGAKLAEVVAKAFPVRF